MGLHLLFLLWKMIQAEDGKEAIDIVSDSRPDLILMDIKLPHMNGIDATKEIRKKHPQLPTIAMSAYTFTEDKDKALAAGCNAYITKPIDKDILYTHLNKYLSS